VDIARLDGATRGNRADERGDCPPRGKTRAIVVVEREDKRQDRRNILYVENAGSGVCTSEQESGIVADRRGNPEEDSNGRLNKEM